MLKLSDVLNTANMQPIYSPWNIYSPMSKFYTFWSEATSHVQTLAICGILSLFQYLKKFIQINMFFSDQKQITGYQRILIAKSIKNT